MLICPFFNLIISVFDMIIASNEIDMYYGNVYILSSDFRFASHCDRLYFENCVNVCQS